MATSASNNAGETVNQPTINDSILSNRDPDEPRKEDPDNMDQSDSTNHGPLNLFSFLAASIRATQQQFGDDFGQEDDDDNTTNNNELAEGEEDANIYADSKEEEQSAQLFEKKDSVSESNIGPSPADELATIAFKHMSQDADANPENEDQHTQPASDGANAEAGSPVFQESDTSSSSDSDSADHNTTTTITKEDGPSSQQSSCTKRRPSTNLEASIHDMISRDQPKNCVLTQQPALHPRLRSQLKETRALALSDKLRQKIGISNDEVLLGEYPCWLLKSILLQGSLYLTDKHLCFFAYLPREQAQVIMSGSLKKRSRKTASYNRFWFVLRQDSLSYFTSSSDLYFPSGTIDLRYALKAEIIADKGKPKSESHTFTVVTETKSYIFKSDTPQSAQQWVTMLQKEIFRSRNEGDSVKIIIPLMNVIDLEQSTIVNVVVSLKIRAIEGDETFAVDEYVLAFFHRGNEAIKAIRESLKDLELPKIAIDDLESNSSASPKYNITEGIVDSTEGTSQTPQRSNPGSGLNLAGLWKGHRNNSSSSSSGLARSDSTTVLRPGRDSARTSRLALTAGASSSANPDPAASPLRGRSKSPFFIREISERLKSIGREDSSQASSRASSQAPSPKASPPVSPRPSNVSAHAPITHVTTVTTDSPSGTSSPSIGTPDRPSSDEDKISYDFLSNSESKTKQEDLDTNMEKLDKPDKPKSNFRPSVVNKVTEMWGGGRKHYPFESVEHTDPSADKYMVSIKEATESNNRFRDHFSLGDGDILVATYYCHLQKAVPLYGKLYLGNNYLCFRRLLPGTNLKMILPISDIENVTKEKGFRFGYSGLVIVICGHEEIFLEFGSAENRDDCEVMILREMDRYKNHRINLYNKNSSSGDSQLFESHRRGVANSETLTAKWISKDDKNMEVPVLLSESGTKSLLRTAEETYAPRPPKGTRFTLLTIGSRGDVQPYIALAKGLIKEGYVARIATHEEFGPWIEKHGIEFREIAGNPSDLMKIMIDHGKMSVGFLKEATTKFRSWIDVLLTSSWEACQGSDILIESPSAMAGIHIAEALQIPYFRAFTMPWTRTRAYPHAFMVPEQKMGGSYNYLTYVMFENILWKGIAHQANKWRRESLGLEATNLDKMQQGSYPFLYCVSPTILVPPVDYGDWVRVTGYWFLDEGSEEYVPPADLVKFIKDTKDEGFKLVYIGFGSILVSDGKEFLNTIIQAVQKAGVRCILAKGWSDRLSSGEKNDIEIPKEIYSVDSVPHDWLFPQMDAAVHHGGCGTTGASLRAGLPTIIKPYFADQFFYANRVEDLGVGVHLKKLTVSGLAKAIWEATNNERIIGRATKIGKAIREENGVDVAIKAIYREWDYSLSLNKKKAEAVANANTGTGASAGGILSAAATGLGSIVTGGKRSHNSNPVSGAASPKSGRDSPVPEDSDSVSTQTDDNSWTVLDVRKHS